MYKYNSLNSDNCFKNICIEDYFPLIQKNLCLSYNFFLVILGKLKPYIKSQAIPKRQSGHVKVVVGKNFESVVLDKTKDVLIEFYAPWCGHCKQIEPIYAELAKKLKNEKNLVIAKMDATANDSPDPFTAEGFPTIYFAPANKKSEPMKFEGDRTVEGFEKFLKEHSAVSFKSKDEL